MRESLTKLSFGAAILFLAPAAALACVCPPIPPNQTAEQTKATFIKEVEDVIVIFSGEVIKSSLLEARFKVDQVWKGNLRDEVVILTGVKMYEDGAYSRSSCDYGDYRVGRKYVVWASGPANELKAHACSRTRPVENAEQDIKTLHELKASGDKRLKAKPQPRLKPAARGEI